MMRRWIVTLLAAGALVAGCAGSDEPASPAETTAPTTTRAAATATSTTTTEPAQAEPIPSVSGTFEIVNTTTDGGDVAIEKLDAWVERLRDGAWEAVEAACVTDPTAPIVVTGRQEFSFACELADPLDSGSDVRVITEAGVFGLDEPVQQAIDVP